MPNDVEDEVTEGDSTETVEDQIEDVENAVEDIQELAEETAVVAVVSLDMVADLDRRVAALEQHEGSEVPLGANETHLPEPPEPIAEPIADPLQELIADETIPVEAPPRKRHWYFR